jgi:carbon-monoxide dehydrogenase large subunit
MFGLAPGRVVVRQGDSDALARGGGTGGSKSLLTSSVALEQGVADVVGRGRALLAGRWATEPSAIHFETGTFSLPGSNRSASIADLAAAFPGTLDGESRGVLKHGSCANGCHACEVEIDPDTGETHVVRYTAVDDFGRVVNEAAVLGQVQGGVVQGLGQALMERAAYDPDSGQLNSASLLDYALPRASDGPAVAWINNGLPSPSNLFGAKACGEAGVSAAPAAIMNALADALASCPASDRLQMPARPVDIWGVIHAVA